MMRLQTLGSIFLLVLGTALLFSHTDREFKLLRPTEGSAYTVPLEHGHSYELSFPLDRPTVTRLGLWLRPLSSQLPDEVIEISVRHAQQQMRSLQLPVVFISDEWFTYLPLDPPLSVKEGEDIHIELHIPDKLSGVVGLQMREPDESFNVNEAKFFQDGVISEAAPAYQAYFRYRPAIALQAGCLFMFFGLYLLLQRKVSGQVWLACYMVLVCFLFILPGVLLGEPYPILFFSSLLVLISMYWYLRKSGVSVIASLFGAHLFAFSTWFPLYYLSSDAASAVLGPVDLRDVFLDPDQTSTIQLGSYIGFPGLAAALIGVAIGGMKHPFVLVIGALGVLAILTAPQASSLILLSTFALAFFAGLGLDSLYTFLGKDDRLAQCIILAITLLALLDLFHVSAGTFEYSIL